MFHRLMNKFDHEIYHYYDEIQRKRTALCEEEFNLRRQNLDRMRIDCETERQKFIELKRLQQHMYVTTRCIRIFHELTVNLSLGKTLMKFA